MEKVVQVYLPVDLIYGNMVGAYSKRLWEALDNITHYSVITKVFAM